MATVLDCEQSVEYGEATAPAMSTEEQAVEAIERTAAIGKFFLVPGKAMVYIERAIEEIYQGRLNFVADVFGEHEGLEDIVFSRGFGKRASTLLDEIRNRAQRRLREEVRVREENEAERVINWLMFGHMLVEILDSTLVTLERLIHEAEKGEYNFVARLFQRHPKLAEAVKNGPTGRKASAIIKAIRERYRDDATTVASISLAQPVKWIAPPTHHGYGLRSAHIGSNGKTARKREAKALREKEKANKK